MVVDIKFLPEFGYVPPEVVPDNDIGHLGWNRPGFSYDQVNVLRWGYVEHGVPHGHIREAFRNIIREHFTCRTLFDLDQLPKDRPWREFVGLCGDNEVRPWLRGRQVQSGRSRSC